MEGKSRPQIRRYRMNFLTNYSLAGLTDNRFWKGFNVGGAVRWEDKGAIGYFGKQHFFASRRLRARHSLAPTRSHCREFSWLRGF